MDGDTQWFYRITQQLQDARESDCHTQLMVDALGHIGFENVAVLQIDSRTGRLDPLALSRPTPGVELRDEIEFVRGKGTVLGQGITGRTARSGESVRVGDVRHDPHYHPLREEIRSELCVPLKLNGRWDGVLNVESRSKDLYTVRDQRFLEAVGTQVALAISHDRLNSLSAAAGTSPSAKLIPVCANCKRMRDEGDRWCRFEDFLHDRTGLTFTHGICPTCRDAY